MPANPYLRHFLLSLPVQRFQYFFGAIIIHGGVHCCGLMQLELWTMLMRTVNVSQAHWVSHSKQETMRGN